MRRTAALAALLLLSLGVAAAATAPKRSAPAFVLAGGGWGHGVGMSQWGAYGQAKAGRDYREILSTYYRGTAMGSAPDTLLKRVRVLVADGLANASVANVAAVFDGDREAIPDRRRDDHRRLRPEAPGGQGRQAGGARRPRDDPRREGRVPVVRGQGVPRRPAGGERSAGASSSSTSSGWRRTCSASSRARCRRTGRSRRSRRRRSRRGRTRSATSSADGRSTSTRTGAARSTTASARRRPAPTRAVRETRGQILTYDGAPAQTLYFSSSGGRTISSLDAFGLDLPYLVSVDDPWDAASPNHAWTPRAPDRRPARGPLRPEGPGRGRRVRPGHAREARGRAAHDGRRPDEHQRGSATSGARLGLKSTGFRLGILRLDPPALPKGTLPVVQLTGVAREVDARDARAPDARGTWVTVEAPLAGGRRDVRGQAPRRARRPSTGSPPTASAARR